MKMNSHETSLLNGKVTLSGSIPIIRVGEREVKKNAAVASIASQVKPQIEPQIEPKSIRLSPEQIEEIHADEYSLMLFYAIRIQAMTIGEIKRQFPEPEPKKAQSVMDRFMKLGLVTLNNDGRFVSNYPDDYINYSHYRYDGDLEAKKDAKVFQLMKENAGNKDYWKDKSYFSIDAFFTSEQTEELKRMVKAIKVKAKTFAGENAKKGIKSTRFRRVKLYDMAWLFVAAVFLSIGAPAFAAPGGGNDPMRFEPISLMARGGGGNDPGAMLSFGDLVDHDGGGGGGHDPDHNKARLGRGNNCETDELGLISDSRLKKLLSLYFRCSELGARVCDAVAAEIEELLANKGTHH